jgi:biopolymer transport protein ExbD
MRLEADADDSDDLGINMTPMIDCVFLLLIFFLAATTFASNEVELDLRLPQAKTGIEGKGDKPIVVNVLADGSIRVDGRVVTLEALKQKVAAAALRNPEQTVLVRGDEKAQFGLGVQVLDLCRLAKVKKVDFAATPQK